MFSYFVGYNGFFIRYSYCMNKSLLIIILSIIMTIAYIDLVDSFRYFDTIMSQVISIEKDKKSKPDIKKKVYSKIQR